jgi:hypothetical protein
VGGVAELARAATHPSTLLQESTMSKLPIAVAAFFLASAAQAAEPTTGTIRQSPPAPVVAAPKTTATPQKTSAPSQQDKMRECNKQATGMKGAERRTFMKTCLSRKA